ncbi:UV DNA damage repair endonuclease UvsE [Anatilimnocola floriformis]|uniref:UV DNA damage repair endonuclease UvsE n=1 Tax=Anatilimnocola floriformis TaxID=2948575 RepID=UPI0020C2969D|nr:UV DNA damage repair endonuclease UvsE [Anatilimnocola floriformis]
MRVGLCCQFAEQAIKFRITTATAVLKLARPAQLQKLSELCLHNAGALQQAIEWCAANEVGAYRVMSQFWPLKTHPTCGYQLSDLPAAANITAQLAVCRNMAASSNVRLSFHPDQFVVLNSPRAEVVESSLAELEYQAEAAELIGADVVNIHGGGAYGDKVTALARFRENLPRLSPRARKLLTLENDDKVYTPSDLLPICRAEHIPLCYDVHHHRCLADGLTIEEATAAAVQTWQGREPLFHISSPLQGWEKPQPQLHHDYIEPGDLPPGWLQLPITLDIEAKAKELAVLRLQAWIKKAQKEPPRNSRALAAAKKRG